VRASIARKLLLMMGRGDVVVAAGSETTLGGRATFWGGWEGKGLLAEGESVEGVSPRPAVEVMANVLERSDRPVVIVSVGGQTEVARLLRERPDLKPKISRLAIMGGCVRPLVVEGRRFPDRAETNLHNDVEAAAEVLAAGLPVTLAPAEVTFLTKLTAEDFARLRAAETPLARSMAAMSLEWGPKMRQFMAAGGAKTFYNDTEAMLHDPLAVAAVAEPSLATVERKRIRVESSAGGIRTIEDPAGPIEVDLVTGADPLGLSRWVTRWVLAPGRGPS